jgi:hypothetical protein
MPNGSSHSSTAQDWLRGRTFSIVPTGVSCLVVLPLLGAGPLGLWLDVGLVLVASELVRHAVYGVALGLTYPILLLARGTSGVTGDVSVPPSLPSFWHRLPG